MPLWREPLVHFVGLGALIFALHSALAPSPRDVVEVTAATRSALTARYVSRAGHPPTEAQLDEQIARWIDEELLLRQAFRLGLDRSDTVVRGRLVEKMRFVLENAGAKEPTEQELSAWLSAHPERYARGGQTSFRHVFFGGKTGQGRATEARHLLVAGDAVAGDHFAHGSQAQGRPAHWVRSRFGAAFAGALEAQRALVWSEPVQSTFGWHLVFVTERIGGRPAALSEVQAEVRSDLLEEGRRRAVRQRLDELRDAAEIRR